MRFDDRIATLLAAEPRDAAERAARWAQLADVYAQSGEGGMPGQDAEIVERLDAWRADVPLSRRRSVSAAIAAQRLPPALVRMFARDAPQVAAAMLIRVGLRGEDWQPLIHAMPPSSRNLVRQRRDLPFDAQQTLALYEQADLALTYRDSGDVIETEPIQIRDLVARIEAYRRDHPVVASQGADTPPVEAFRFEMGADGVILWAEGVNRTALIGLDLSEAGDETLARHIKAGHDFEGGGLVIPGASNAAGEWAISGKAIGPSGGGFRCLARRAASPETQPLLAGALAPDSVRQLAHELRTPLNAIRGFSEMISGQFLGPVAGAYRDRAIAVASDAARLSGVIDDLDLAAKIDSNALARLDGGRCDAGQMLRRTAAQLRAVAEARALTIRMSLPSTLPDAALSDEEAGRLIGRFLAALAATADAGSTIPIALSARHGALELSIGKPAPLLGLSDAVLRRSALGADAHDGPPLGFGFALRLAEAHAAACGGRLAIEDARFVVILPLAAGTELDAAASRIR